MISLSLPTSPITITSPPSLKPPNNRHSRQKRPSQLNQTSTASLNHRLIRHVDDGDLGKAISTLHLLCKNGTHPDLVTYSLLLKSCIRSHNFKLGKLVHHHLTRSRLELDSVILNSLISLYSKCGDVDEAERVFYCMGDKRDLVSWSSLISCYANNGMEFDAFSTFLDMIEFGYFPNEYCFTGVIRACSNRGLVSIGEVIFGFVLKTGYFESDVCVGCSLIEMFVKGRNDALDARKVFDKMTEKNVVSWTLVITRFQQMGYSREALELFLDMVLSGFSPDRFTLSGLFAASADVGMLVTGQQLHSWAVKSGLYKDVCVGCSLIDFYAKCAADGSMNSSRMLFNRMKDHNVMSWTAVISGYANRGHSREAIELFKDMIQGHVKPNQFTFSVVLKACADLSDLRTGQQVYVHAVKMGLGSVDCVGNALISVYARCGSVEEARKVFDILIDQTLVSPKVSIDTNAKYFDFDEANDMFSRNEGVEGGTKAFTFASLLSGASSVGAISMGEQIHACVLKTSSAANLNICNALISMYSRCGNIEAAFNIFDRMQTLNVVSWSSMVTGYAKHGLAEKALETFNKMLEANVKPNSITYIAVLSACSHVGLVSEGWKHYNSMTAKYGIVPRTEHYACMVDLLGRSGRLSEALELINHMPIKADPLILRTFLGACHVYGNIDLGALAAKLLLEQDPGDTAAYILLSNLYASAGRWKEVSEIRKKMRELNLTKEAGCSWIEVENKLHKFFVGDTLHPMAHQIYQELDQLALEIRKLGYVPNTDLVLHDVEKEQKEQYLLHHSEKIAVAFGLISTFRSKPIRVFKNLRVCRDCHTAMKYISVVRGREVVVRDSNRFHHFKEGTCSCNDYW